MISHRVSVSPPYNPTIHQHLFLKILANFLMYSTLIQFKSIKLLKAVSKTGLSCSVSRSVCLFRCVCPCVFVSMCVCSGVYVYIKECARDATSVSEEFII